MGLLVAAFAAPAHSEVIDSFWVGPAAPAVGDWNDPANWDPAIVPRNGLETFRVFLDGGLPASAICRLDSSSSTFVETLAISAGDRLHLQESAWLRVLDAASIEGAMNILDGAQWEVVGPISLTIDGEVHVSAEAETTRIRVFDSPTFAGMGKIVLGGPFAEIGPGPFANHCTIEGGGSIRTSAFDNFGMIDANRPDVPLFVQAGIDPGIVNAGTMRASGGALLQLDTAYVTNTETGVIHVGVDSQLRLTGNFPRIQGGVLEGEGELSVWRGLLRTVTNRAVIVVEPEGRLRLLDGLRNDGTLSFDPTPELPSALIVVIGQVPLTGEGTLHLNDGGRLTGSNPFLGNHLINGSDHTIAGAGNVGSFGFGIEANVLSRVENHGLIQANNEMSALSFGPLDALLNDGVVEAVDGATLRIGPGQIDNTNGLIRARAGGIVEFFRISPAAARPDLHGGRVVAEDTGVVRIVDDVNLSEVTLEGTVWVDAGGALRPLGVVTNNGTIRLDTSPGNEGRILVQGPGTLAGSGELVLENCDGGQIALSGGGTLTNGATHTIRGCTTIEGGVVLINEGLIRADQPGGMFRIADLPRFDGAPASFNRGVIEARDGATVSLYSFSLDNTDGVIRAGDGSVVEFETLSWPGAPPFDVLLNGVITTVGSGEIRFRGGSVLENVTNEGRMRVDADDHLTLRDFVNAGTVAVEAPASFVFEGPVTNLGSGVMTFDMDEPFVVETIVNQGDLELVNLSLTVPTELDNHGRILGVSGARGAPAARRIDTLNLANDGEIVAEMGVTLQLESQAGIDSRIVTNAGLFGARSGGTLELINVPLDNTDGVVRAADASVVRIAYAPSGRAIAGGVLETEGTGEIHLVDFARLEQVRNAGLLRNDDAVLVIRERLENDGTIRVIARPGQDQIQIEAGTVVLDGAGELVLIPGSGGRPRVSSAGFLVHRLVNGPGHTIRGSAELGRNDVSLLNQGQIIADGTETITIDVRDTTDGFRNEGLLHAFTGDVTIDAGPFANAGTVRVDLGRSIVRIGDYRQTEGATEVDGALTVQGGTMTLEGGKLSGAGGVEARVDNVGAVVMPGQCGTQAAALVGTAGADPLPGTLTIAGDYTQSAKASLSIALDGPGDGTAGRVVVSGQASLAGGLTIAATGDIPAVGTAIDVLTATAIAGRFDTIESDLPNGLSATATYASDRVTLNIVRPGDLNCDGVVSIGDVNAFALALTNPSAYADAFPECSALNGDVNRDGAVSVADINGFVALLTGD